MFLICLSSSLSLCFSSSLSLSLCFSLFLCLSPSLPFSQSLSVSLCLSFFFQQLSEGRGKWISVSSRPATAQVYIATGRTARIHSKILSQNRDEPLPSQLCWLTCCLLLLSRADTIASGTDDLPSFCAFMTFLKNMAKEAINLKESNERDIQRRVWKGRNVLTMISKIVKQRNMASSQITGPLMDGLKPTGSRAITLFMKKGGTKPPYRCTKNPRALLSPAATQPHCQARSPRYIPSSSQPEAPDRHLPNPSQKPQTPTQPK